MSAESLTIVCTSIAIAANLIGAAGVYLALKSKKNLKK